MHFFVVALPGRAGAEGTIDPSCPAFPAGGPSGQLGNEMAKFRTASKLDWCS